MLTNKEMITTEDDLILSKNLTVKQ